MIIVLEPGQQISIQFKAHGHVYHKDAIAVRYNENGTVDAGPIVKGELDSACSVNLFQAQDKQPITEEQKLEALRRSVQRRGSRLVLYASERGPLYVEQARQDASGQLVSGYIINGGYRFTLRDGIMRTGRARSMVRLMPDYEVLYVPSDIQFNAARKNFTERYVAIFEWADTIPKEFRTSFTTVKDAK
jgi:hypothetical protein